MEQQCRVRLRRQFVTFAARVIGEEDEAAQIEALQQHDTGRRPTVHARRRERHRVGLRNLCFQRFVEPARKLPIRVSVDLRFVKRCAFIFGSKVGDIHGGQARFCPDATPRPPIDVPDDRINDDILRA
jgi:hypothetical protein